MLAVAREICGPELAADVVQDAFLRVLRERKFDPSRSSIRTFLLTVTRSVAIDYVRRDTAARARDDRHARSSLRRAEVDDAIATVLDAESRQQLTAAVNRLSPRERELIVIAFHERLTYREIAVRLNIPEGTVKSRIRLALVKMRVHLSEYYARPATSDATGDEHDAHRPSNAE
jgi:RNA polymerase sigma-70 factor (ECF subfamily)